MKVAGIMCMVLISSAATNNVKTTEWVSTNNKDGINSYVGKTSSNGVIPTRVEMVVKASPEKVLKVIADVDNYNLWVPYCKNSFTIQRVSDTVSYSYQRISAPLVTDRDLAVRMTIRKRTNKHYEVLLTAVPNFVKAESNAVRIEHFIASYNLTVLPDNSTKVEQVCEVNIGGSIPRFLLKWANRNQPHETFENLRRQIANS